MSMVATEKEPCPVMAAPVGTQLATCPECGRCRLPRYAWQQADCATCQSVWLASLPTAEEVTQQWVADFEARRGLRQAALLRRVAIRDGIHL